MRAREIITEIEDWNVEGMYAGQYGLPSEKRKELNQILIGTYDDYYKVWTRDLREVGVPTDYDIEVITEEIPHPFVTPDNIDDHDLQRKFDGPREYVVLKMELKHRTLSDKESNPETGQSIDGHRVHFVQKVPAGVGSDINMVDFYIWIINKLGTAIISDSKQSKGGASIWKRLASDPRVDVFAYSYKYGFGQTDDEGDADKWNTWAGTDQEVVDDAKLRRELGHPEKEIKSDVISARRELGAERDNVLFAVPSNRSMHS